MSAYLNIMWKEKPMQPVFRRGWRRPRVAARILLVGACLTLATSTVDAAGSFKGAMHEQFAMVACPAGAPATLACRRFSARVGDQRNDGSSKNPIGIF